jgi:hypothetical protein
MPRRKEPMQTFAFRLPKDVLAACRRTAEKRDEYLGDALRELATHYAREELRAALTAKPTLADRAWTCRECDTRIADVQPETWLAVPCGHYVTEVQMVTMAYGPPSWPVALSMEPRAAKPDTEETP